MGFGDLKTDSGVSALNSFLTDKSYIEGYVPSQADLIVFSALTGPPKNSYAHALRWFTHISSYTDQEKSCFGSTKKTLNDFGSAGAAAPAKNGDDDFDLFGSSDEEEEVKPKAQEKKKKPAVVAKSMLVIDVKPWDDETDMKLIEDHVRSIATDGLIWGTSKLVPVGYGIKKLQISAVIEDDKVSTDFLEEQITSKDDLIQSMDIAAFNKV